MHLSAILGALALSSLASSALASTLTTSRSTHQRMESRKESCPSYYFITTRGCCDSRKHSEYIMPLVDEVFAMLPGGKHYETDYDSDLEYTSVIAAMTNDGDVQKVYQGADVLSNYTLSLTRRCPDTKIAMHSYSFGTIVQIIAQNHLLFPASRINSNTLWGSLFWDADEEGAAGTAKEGYGAISALGIPLMRTPFLLGSVTQDYCLDGDYFCTSKDGHNDAHHHYTNHSTMHETAKYIVAQLTQ